MAAYTRSACNWLCSGVGAKFKSKEKKLEEWRTDINLLHETGRYIIHYPKLIFQIIIANVIKFFAIYLVPSYIMHGECSIRIVECILLICVINMIDAVIPVPSGIGSFEFFFYIFFETITEPSLILPSVFVYRAATWFAPFIIGMVLWIVTQFNIGKKS